MILLSSEKKCTLKPVFVQCTYIDVVCQYVHNAMSSFATKCVYEILFDIFAPYVFHDAQVSIFRKIKKESHGYTSITQRKHFNESDQPKTDPHNVDSIAVVLYDAQD